MPRLVDDALAKAAIDLMVPYSRTHPGPDDFGRALELLVRNEQSRRGAPDGLTGALSILALLHGTLLRSEFDLSVHGHTGWPVGAIIVDVQGLITINADLGMPAGEEVLKAVASTMARALPGTRLVRVHGDCFAALFLPSTGLELEARHVKDASDALAETGELLAASVTNGPVGFTISALRLRIIDPSHWQVLGPLLVAEIERAHVMARRGLASGIQERELRLDGRVPTPPG